MKRYKVQFEIDLKDESNPAWITPAMNNLKIFDQMYSDESVVPDSIEVTEVPIPELPT
jgi:hypothetical protein